MTSVSFHVVDGVDKGRRFLNLAPPITIGREEGNMVRLNDERVSRFHVKIQEDHGQIVLTDLDSTNGTCVNGEPVQLRLLRPGDRVSIGRSTLVFGTLEEIAESLKSGRAPSTSTLSSEFAAEATDASASNYGTQMLAPVSGGSSVSVEEELSIFQREPPPLPGQLSPAQAAQFSEVIDYLHRALAHATRQIHIPPSATEAKLPIASWQQVQLVLTLLAQYSRQISEPEDPNKTA